MTASPVPVNIRFDPAEQALYILDQTLLPNEEREIRLTTLEEMVEAIRSLRARGAPAIGICAACAAGNARVTGVEQVAGAIACARRNAEANGVADRCRFVAADATEWMAREGARGRFDAVIMDPPRAGSTPEFLAGVAALAPERVAYVSCNVVTQARDLELLRGHGYRLERVTPVDMFPHTRHVESVVTLRRR